MEGAGSISTFWISARNTVVLFAVPEMQLDIVTHFTSICEAVEPSLARFSWISKAEKALRSRASHEEWEKLREVILI